MPLSILGLLKHGSPNDTANLKKLARDSFVEFLATTVFVFNGTLSATSTGRKLVGQGSTEDVARVLPIAMAFGVSIMTLAYAIGHITGGHMNPGVSFMMFLRRQISFTKMCAYVFAQLVGAVLGSSLMWGCISGLEGEAKLDGTFHHPPFELGATMLDTAITTGNGFLIEFMGSFFFFFVIAQTALDKRGIATSMFPAIPIGFALVVTHICLIPFTGCGVNPARTFGPSVVVCMVGDNCDAVMGDWYWIYYVAPLLAAWAVAEMTLLLEMDVGEDPVSEEAIKEEQSPEEGAMEALKLAATAEEEQA